MAPDASSLSSVKPPTSGTRQDQDAESFGFEQGDLQALSTPPKFDNVDDERQYLKIRLALACRIFAQHGLDHHIVRLRSLGQRWRFPPCGDLPKLGPELTSASLHSGWTLDGSRPR